jgi:hypothetical protein
MLPEPRDGTEPAPLSIAGYASFWDEPQPARPAPVDSNDAYAAFAVAADI